MRATISISLALTGLLFSASSVACDQPAGVKIPDGQKATTEEMTAAGQSFHRFMLNMQNYQVCLEDEANEERARAGDENKSQVQARENRFVSKHNAASAEMTRTSESFKTAVVDFEARQ